MQPSGCINIPSPVTSVVKKNIRALLEKHQETEAARGAQEKAEDWRHKRSPRC